MGTVSHSHIILCDFLLSNHSPFTFCRDDNFNDQKNNGENSNQRSQESNDPLLDSQNMPAIEYKKGYVMRKCCYDSNNKKSNYSLAMNEMFVIVI